MDEGQYYSYEGVSEGEPPKKNFRIPIIILTVIVIASGVSLLVLTGRLPNPFKQAPQKVEVTEKDLPNSASKTAATKAKKTTSQKTLEKKLVESVAKTSTASKTATAKYQDIQKYIEAAQKEASLDRSYQYYVKAYSVIQAAYKDSQDGKYTTAMADLKKIMVRYPQYKQGDFPAP